MNCTCHTPTSIAKDIAVGIVRYVCACVVAGTLIGYHFVCVRPFDELLELMRIW